MRDFIKEFCKTMVFFFQKISDILNPKFHQNSIVYYFFFIFLAFLTSFFLFYLYIVVKKFLKFVLFYCMDQRFYQRIMQNYDFFFKKFQIFEIKNFTKIPLFNNSFLFFYIFVIFFLFISPIQSFIGRIGEFIDELWKFLEVLLKKYRFYFEIIFFFKILWFPICFFFNFFIGFDIFFSISSLCTCKKLWKFLCFFILWIRDFIKGF